MARPVSEGTSARQPISGWRPLISAWSAVSPFGIGRVAFADGMRDGSRRTVGTLDEDIWPVPVGQACLVPDLDIPQLLGKRGTRSMDRATGLAVAAVGGLLDEHDACRLNIGEDIGVVLGTSAGSVQSMMDFTRDSLTQSRPFLVDPGRFPNTVMNCATGQCAIWHRLRGPNVTLAVGHASMLAVIKYAGRLQRSGCAGTMVCGAVEEFSVERTWLTWHSNRARTISQPLGEGCGAFLLEPPGSTSGRRLLAEVRALEFALPASAADAGGLLARCITRALARAELSEADVWAVAPSHAAGADGDWEQKAINAALGSRRPRVVATAERVGDTGAASGAFQLAGLLALADGVDEAWGRAALVTSVDVDGVIGCGVLRLLGPAGCEADVHDRQPR